MTLDRIPTVAAFAGYVISEGERINDEDSATAAVMIELVSYHHDNHNRTSLIYRFVECH